LIFRMSLTSLSKPTVDVKRIRKLVIFADLDCLLPINFVR